MGQINTKRVILGGLLAGLIMNIVDAVTNGVVLGARWKAETEALNPGLMAKAAVSSTAGWVAVDFLLGILLLWVYAAIRPGFGPGPRTAITAALAVWLASHLFYSSYIFMGLYSDILICASSVGGLLAILLGALAGARVYQE